VGEYFADILGEEIAAFGSDPEGLSARAHTGTRRSSEPFDIRAGSRGRDGPPFLSGGPVNEKGGISLPELACLTKLSGIWLSEG
jgi:hypothetical protein